jgi:holo-[acyl-carrier protein] synthase
MIVGVGADLARVSRVRELSARFGDRFVARVFTDAERKYCERRREPFASLTARFAAKEAVMKALAAGWGSGVRFKDIEVVLSEAGAPRIELSGGARKRAEELGIVRLHLSLAHEGDFALAQAVAEGGQEESR